MNGTIINAGSFVSDGSAKILQIRSDLDYMNVVNYTSIATPANNAGYQYYWQRGMAAGTGIRYAFTGAQPAVTIATMTSNGFTLVNSSADPIGALNNGSTQITAISGAPVPVATCGSTAGMSAGSVVRLYNATGAHQLDGIDFTIGYNTFGGGGTTFSLDYMAQIIAGTNTQFRQIKFDPLYYPRRRIISKITQATSAVITMTVTHGYKVGQTIRLSVPDDFGMIEMDGLVGTITAIDTTTTTGNTITVNIDSSAFTAFAWPLTGAPYTTPAEVVPVGEDTAQALTSGVDILTDATINTGYIGIILGAGATAPAGQVIADVGDTIYWTAGKSFNL